MTHAGTVLKAGPDALPQAKWANPAHAGSCWIDALEIDGRAVAMAIVMFAGSKAFFWKIAYDEQLSSLSPGVQLTLELTNRLAAEPGVTMVDSCAVPDHPMIDHIWRDRMDICDFLVGAAGAQPLFERIAAHERRRRAARAVAKAGWHKVRRLLGR